MDRDSLQLILDNPDLPVYAWVDGEICQESYGWWLGKITRAKITEVANLDLPDGLKCEGCFGEYTNIIKDDTDEEIFEILINDERFSNLSDEEAEKQVKEILDNLDWHKVIFIYIEMPSERI